MSKIKVPTTSNLTELQELVQYVSIAIDAIVSEMNGRIDLTDNCSTSLVSVVFPTANSNVQSSHTLGRVPRGYIVAGSSAAMSIYDGTSSNTADLAYFRSNAVGTAQILLF